MAVGLYNRIIAVPVSAAAAVAQPRDAVRIHRRRGRRICSHGRPELDGKPRFRRPAACRARDSVAGRPCYVCVSRRDTVHCR